MALLGANGQPATGPSPGPSTPIQAEDPPAPMRVTTAFLVFQLPNGQWMASEDITVPVIPSRKPVPDDLMAGTANVSAQIIARKTADMAAKITVQTQMAVAQQMQSQQLSPVEAAALAAAQRRL